MIKSDSKSELDSFLAQGWFKSPKLLPKDLIDDAIKATEEFYQGNIDFQLSSIEAIANDSDDPNSALRNNEFVSLQKAAIAKLAFHPMILSTVAKLLGTSEVRLFADSLVTKKPQLIKSAGIVGWHTDKAYWPTCSSNQLLTAWIPLQDVTLEMGPLEVINKSNNWKHQQEIKALFGFGKPDLRELETKLRELGYPVEKKSMTLKAGEVSFHHCDTIHCSRPNTSNKNRMALAVHFQGKNNFYQIAHKENGERITISYDKLCRKDHRGYPDYSDPTFFPLLWQNGKKVY